MTSAPRALLLERVLKHWETCEPVALNLLAHGWDVTAVVPRPLGAILDRSVQHYALQERFRTERFTVRRVARLLRRPHDLLILGSPRVWQPKMARLRPLAAVLDLALQLVFVRHFRRRRRPAAALVIHRLAWVASPVLTVKTVIGVSRRLDEWLRRRALAEAAVVIVKSQPMREALAQLGAVSAPVLVSPLAVFRSGTAPPARGPGEQLRLVVSGRIDQSTRDYDWLDLMPESLRRLLSVTFLGTPSRPVDHAFLSSLAARGFPQPAVVTGGFIDAEAFEREMAAAHVLLCPLKPTMGGQQFGAVQDAVRYGRAVLVPAPIAVGAEAEPSVVRYAGAAGLVETLRELASAPGAFERVAVRAYEHASHFSPSGPPFADELRRRIFGDRPPR